MVQESASMGSATKEISSNLMGKIHAVVITASDACARGEREDKSGESLVEMLTEMGAHIVAKELLTDDLAPLADTLRAYADRSVVHRIRTTVGTSFSLHGH